MDRFVMQGFSHCKITMADLLISENLPTVHWPALPSPDGLTSRGLEPVINRHVRWTVRTRKPYMMVYIIVYTVDQWPSPPSLRKAPNRRGPQPSQPSRFATIPTVAVRSHLTERFRSPGDTRKSIRLSSPFQFIPCISSIQFKLNRANRLSLNRAKRFSQRSMVIIPSIHLFTQPPATRTGTTGPTPPALSSPAWRYPGPSAAAAAGPPPPPA